MMATNPNSKTLVLSSFVVLLLLVNTASAVLEIPTDKFDHSASLTGVDDCALLSLVVDESGSMMFEQDFLANQVMPMLVSDYRVKNYDRIFVCSHGFGAAQNKETGFAFHGCVDAMTWSVPATTDELAEVMGSWRVLGGVEDPYLGILMGIENTPATISGHELTTTCGTMFKNMILLTDEDRDVFNANTITKADISTELANTGYVFNGIVNLDISSPPDQENFEALGFFPSDDTPGKFEFFVPEGSNLGTYSTIYKDEYLKYLDEGLEAGNSIEDYVSLAMDTKGAIYDLGMLRLEASEADYSTVFVNSLSDTQVREIENAESSGNLQTVTNFGDGGDKETSETETETSETETSKSETETSETETSETETSDTASNPSVLGDPHFKTWQNEHYEFHGQCDMVLVKDPNFAKGLGLDIHIRAKLVRYWSYIQSVAIRIGTDILELQGSADPEDYSFHYWINYEYQAEIDTLGGFPVKGHSKKVHSHKNSFEIDLSSAFGNDKGPKIIVSSFKEFLKVEFENASEEAFGNTAGLLGHFKTGATLARDGSTVLNDFTDLGQEWQVIPSDGHIFHESSTPQFPELCIEPEDPRGDRARRLAESSITEAEAEAVCSKLKDPLDQKDCVYDILATQDMDMVGAF
ncbi:unnamed protein product [Cylindrotheca closterium]|uniref:VWFD domain-containing protein n=1 Tax=Cylindrotheca closterium TaxID=2856 RepID=A0AAD2GB67_9STRA|nr:unnamed protein product [Cylindrotheca closterium]